MIRSIAKIAIGCSLMEIGKHLDRRDVKVRVNGKEVSTGTKTAMSVGTFFAGVVVSAVGVSGLIK